MRSKGAPPPGGATPGESRLDAVPESPIVPAAEPNAAPSPLGTPESDLDGPPSKRSQIRTVAVGAASATFAALLITIWLGGPEPTPVPVTPAPAPGPDAMADDDTAADDDAATEDDVPPEDRFAAAGLEMVLIRGGTFRMGSERGRRNERPRSRVQVADFSLSKTEVTNAQYQRCVAAGACEAPHYGDGRCMSPDWKTLVRQRIGGRFVVPETFQDPTQPVVCVTWSQARAFAAWVVGRLPSESEWEFAARSRGLEREYPWGDAPPTCRWAVMRSEKDEYGCGKGTPWPVCSRPAGNTAQGLCDMAGNVQEWTADRADARPAAPVEAYAANRRVTRGGGWCTHAWWLRASAQFDLPPDLPSNVRGFRVAGPSAAAQAH